MCEQVSVGVCDWGWFAPAESHHRWAISVPVTLSPLSDPCSVCGRRLRSVLVPRFLRPAASWTPIAGPWLPIASLRYPPQPYGKLRICLRKAQFLRTEAPPLPYGKLRFCLRKLRLCPTESSASAYGSSASALRKAPFSFSLCITSCNKLSFRNWILPSSLWQSSLRFLPPGVGLTGSSRPSKVLLEFKALILKTEHKQTLQSVVMLDCIERILIDREDISHLG